MHLSNDRVAGVLGATTSLWWGFDQIDMAFHNWDLQSALFYVLHMQVAFLFVCRHHAVTQRNDMCTWVICGASLASVYFFDLSRRTSGTVYGLGESLTYSGCVLSILAIAALGKGFGVLPAFRCLATEGPDRKSVV